MSEQNGTRKPSTPLLTTNLVEITPIRFETTRTLAIAPNISIKCKDKGYFNFVIGFSFKNIYDIDNTYQYRGWEGIPPLLEVWLCKNPGVIANDDIKIVNNFDPRDEYCLFILSLLMTEFNLSKDDVIRLLQYLGGFTARATREYWSQVNFKIAAHNQLIDDGLDVGQVISLKIIKGKCFVKYTLPKTDGRKQGHTILGVKKILNNSRHHLDITPILDNYEFGIRKYDEQSPFLGFNVILSNHDEHDGYIIPAGGGWVKVERNRNLKTESLENNKFIKPIVEERFSFKKGDDYPLPVCADIYEAYISARDYLVNNPSVNRESLMDFECNYLDKGYKLSYLHYHKNLNKQTGTRGLGLQSFKKKVGGK
jgi:hypothetical protein